MPPFRFYIFISFVFFLLLNFTTQKEVNLEESSRIASQIKNNNNISKRFGNDTILINDSIIDIEITNIIEIHKDSLQIEPNNTKYNLVKQGDETKAIERIFEQPDIFIDKIFKNFSWAMFILMPIYAFFLWLFFRRKYKYYIGHLIFAINQHAFIFIIFILLLLINLTFPNKSVSFENWILVCIPVYLYLGSKKLFQRGWGSTFFRLFSVISLYFIVLLTSIVTVLYYSVF